MRRTSNSKAPSLCSNVVRVARVSICVVSSFIVCGCHEAPRPTAIEPPLVASIRVAGETVPPPRYSTVIEPLSRRRLGFSMPGVLRSVHVRAGDRVVRGQVLAELDERDAAANLEADITALRNAEREFKSLEALATRGSATTRQVENAAVSLARVRSQHLSSRQRLKQFSLVAVIDGTVQERAAEPGEVLGAGAVVLTLDEAGPMRARFGCNEREVGAFAIGETAHMRLSGADEVLAGKIIAISAAPHTRDGLYAVDVQLPEHSGAPIPAGTPVEVEPAREGEKVMMVPLEAIVRRRGKAQVFMLEESAGLMRVHNVEVALGRSFGDRVVLRSGLARDSEIVAEGAYFLEDGEIVRVRR